MQLDNSKLPFTVQPNEEDYTELAIMLAVYQSVYEMLGGKK